MILQQGGTGIGIELLVMKSSSTPSSGGAKGSSHSQCNVVTYSVFTLMIMVFTLRARCLLQLLSNDLGRISPGEGNWRRSIRWVHHEEWDTTDSVR